MIWKKKKKHKLLATQLETLWTHWPFSPKCRSKVVYFPSALLILFRALKYSTVLQTGEEIGYVPRRFRISNSEDQFDTVRRQSKDMTVGRRMNDSFEIEQEQYENDSDLWNLRYVLSEQSPCSEALIESDEAGDEYRNDLCKKECGLTHQVVCKRTCFLADVIRRQIDDLIDDIARMRGGGKRMEVRTDVWRSWEIMIWWTYMSLESSDFWEFEHVETYQTIDSYERETSNTVLITFCVSCRNVQIRLVMNKSMDLWITIASLRQNIDTRIEVILADDSMIFSPWYSVHLIDVTKIQKEIQSYRSPDYDQKGEKKKMISKCNDRWMKRVRIGQRMTWLALRSGIEFSRKRFDTRIRLLQ